MQMERKLSPVYPRAKPRDPPPAPHHSLSPPGISPLTTAPRPLSPTCWLLSPTSFLPSGPHTLAPGAPRPLHPLSRPGLGFQGSLAPRPPLLQDSSQAQNRPPSPPPFPTRGTRAPCLLPGSPAVQVTAPQRLAHRPAPDPRQSPTAPLLQSRSRRGIKNADFWAALPEIHIPTPHFFRGWGPAATVSTTPSRGS